MADIVTKNDAFFSELLSPTAAKWSAGVAFDRSNGLPLDQWSVFQTKAKAEEYLTNAKAYPGQVIAYAETSGEMTVCVLSQNAAGTGLELKPVGVIPTAGNKIVVNGDVISHTKEYGYKLLQKASNPLTLEWAPDPGPSVVQIYKDGVNEDNFVIVAVAACIDGRPEGILNEDEYEVEFFEDAVQISAINIDLPIAVYYEDEESVKYYDYIAEVLKDSYGHILGYVGGNFEEDQDTTYTADNKTITISGDENTISLFGSATAANGTLPMLEEVDGKQQLVWKTLEDIGAGDGNDNTTYSFSFNDQKVTITPSFNDVAQSAVELDLTSFATEEEMATAIQEAIDALPADENTTYSLSQEGMTITLTPSKGEADTVTIDAYTKSETDSKIKVAKDRADEAYSLAEGKVSSTTYATDKKALQDEDAAIRTIAEEARDTINTFLTSEKIDDTVNTLKEIQAEIEKMTDATELETALASKADKTALESVDKKFENYTTTEALNTLLSGKQDVIPENTYDAYGAAASAQSAAEAKAAELATAAKEAAIEDAKKYEAKADASAVYTKEETDNLLSGKADNGTVGAIADRVKAIEDAPYATEGYVAEALESYTTTNELTELLSEKANVDDVAATYATKEEVGEVPAGDKNQYADMSVVEFIQKRAQEILDAATGGTSESAASVKQQLDDYKTENAPKFEKLEGIEAGAQVNKIEAVVVNNGNTEENGIPAAKLAVDLVGKTVTLNDSALQADIKTAQTTATNAAAAATNAQAAADANALVIQSNTSAIENLQTANASLIEEITALKINDEKHEGQFEAHNESILEIQGDIIELQTKKAAQEDLLALQGRVGTAENDITKLDGALKAHVTEADGKYATKTELNIHVTEAEGKYATKEELTTHVTEAEGKYATKTALEAEVERATAAEQEIAGTVTTLSGTVTTEIARVEGLVATEAARADAAEKVNAKAIEDITKEGGAIATAVAAEAAIARAAEKANADEITRIDNALKAAIENEGEGLDSIKELATWIEEHGPEATNMAKAIEANAEAIADIYTPAEGETAASGVLVTEIARVEEAIADGDAATLEAAKSHSDTNLATAKNYSDTNLATAKGYSDTNLATAKSYSDDNLATAKGYTDTKVGELEASIHGVDDKSIKLNDSNKAYVAEVSTDLLVQGTQELVFCAGNAFGF